MNEKKTSNKYWLYFAPVLIIAIALIVFNNTKCTPAPAANDSTTLIAAIPELPDTLFFCGERIPLEYFDVKESLEREMLVNSYWHSQTIWLIQKSTRYFPAVEPILKKYGIPEDFKYLAMAESGYSHVVSPAGATGFWQLMEGTAKDYGLEVNNEVDERYHLEKSTEAACKYIRESYEKYGNWTLTAASYNVGRRGIDRQITRQKENDYYNLLLNSETARYVFRIIALKMVIENPAKFNFFISKENAYKPIAYKEVKVNSTVESWADFAHENNTNYKMLKFLNPWLRESKLTNKHKKDYTIKLPKKKARLVKSK